jgi:hypothetical protein
MSSSHTEDEVRSNVKSTSYMIIKSWILCRRCKRLTPVFAFTLAEDYQSRSVNAKTAGDKCGRWDRPGIPVVLSFVVLVNDPVAIRIRGMTPCFRIASDCKTGQTYWMNHCEYCDAPAEEEELHAHPEGPFGRVPRLGPHAIRYAVPQPFIGRAGAETEDADFL